MAWKLVECFLSLTFPIDTLGLQIRRLLLFCGSLDLCGSLGSKLSHQACVASVLAIEISSSPNNSVHCHHLVTWLMARSWPVPGFATVTITEHFVTQQECSTDTHTIPHSICPVLCRWNANRGVWLHFITMSKRTLEAMLGVEQASGHLPLALLFYKPPANSFWGWFHGCNLL